MKHRKEIPDDFMRRMPDAPTYYGPRVRDLTNVDAHGWASALCPLARYPRGHRVRINMRTGHFSCVTCGNGDLLFFHMLLTGRRFKPCVLELINGGDE